MKIECGTDIIEIKRIQESIETLGDKFINKIFTEKEKQYCESKNKMKYQHYAARFAGKEAVYKAISGKDGMNWKDIEIINNEFGKPEVLFYNSLKKSNIKQVSISLSHCQEYATANCIVLTQDM